MDITPKIIRSAIEKAPPFQQEEVAEKFHDIEIAWPVSLWSVSKKDSEKVSIMARYQDDYPPFISGTVNLRFYPWLKIAREGEKFVIKGKILKVDSLGIDLKDCEIFNDSINPKPYSYNPNYQTGEYINQLQNNKHFSEVGIVAGGSITAGGDIVVGEKKVAKENSLNEVLDNRWYHKPIGNIILTVIAGLIVAGLVYFLGWD